MAKKTEESKIVDDIIKYLATVNDVVHFERRSASSPGFRSGEPDIWFVLFDGQHAIHIEIEVKTPDGELRPEQIRVHEEFNSKHIPCYVVRSVDEVKSIITIYKKITV